MLNMIKIFLSNLNVADHAFIIIVIVIMIGLAALNFKFFKQLMILAMKEAQSRFFGATGEFRKTKAIEIFRNMKIIKESKLFKLIPAVALYNLFEKIYKKYKNDIKK